MRDDELEALLTEWGRRRAPMATAGRAVFTERDAEVFRQAGADLAEGRRNARAIRVFVSSTFRDMHAEREELLQHVFPKLRKLCEGRGVAFTEVDLRWGIRDEQAAEGEALAICLEEIDRCRPFFVGILGEHYGWVPEQVPEDLIEQHPWLAEHGGKSVTELEIIHGALRDPAVATCARFYLRDPAYVERLPADVRGDFVEEDPSKQSKLQSLKEAIRRSGLPVEEGYRDPQELGRLVLRDIGRAIDELFPPEEVPDPLAREAAEHEAYARNHSQVYVGRQEYFERLDAHAASDGRPLVILGERGSGKSALLANWALQYRVSHPKDLLIMHFVNASHDSADWAAMSCRILGELRRHFSIEQPIPQEREALRAAFADWLHLAAARGRVVLILDALDQLEDRDQAPDLVWLPLEIPPEIRLSLSTLPGRPLDALRRRGWSTLTVEPLEPESRRQLVASCLAQHAKALSPAQMERIAGAEHAASPRYLRALLEELRQSKAHGPLDERIDHYLAARSTPELYGKILARYEQDFECERPGLVREAMTLLWGARRGLAEAELLDLLGSEGNPLPCVHWARLHLAAEASLVSRSGRVSFLHNDLRNAVERRYLAGDDERQAVHKRLADRFGARDSQA